MLCCLADYVRAADIQRINVRKKGIRIEFCNFQNGLVLFLRSLKHLILSVISITGKVANVRYIHDVLFVVAKKSKGSVKSVQKNVCPQVSYMGIIVNSRSASVKTAESRPNRHKFLHLASHCVK